MSEVNTYKKITDVELVGALNGAANILINDNGALKQVAAIEFAQKAEIEGVVKTVNGIAPDENGAIESYHSVSFNFVDGSAIVPGLINYYGAEAMAELCDYYAQSGMYNVECRRMIMTNDNRVQFRTCIGNEVIKDADGNITGQRLFFGDDLCPVILDIASNKIIFDPDWVAPEANITESAANTLVDTKVAELATTVDTQIAELAAQELTLPKSAGVVDHGTAGQFAVSDGMGGIMWKTLVEAEEVAY